MDWKTAIFLAVFSVPPVVLCWKWHHYHKMGPPGNWMVIGLCLVAFTGLVFIRVFNITVSGQYLGLEQRYAEIKERQDTLSTEQKELRKVVELLAPMTFSRGSTFTGPGPTKEQIENVRKLEQLLQITILPE